MKKSETFDESINLQFIFAQNLRQFEILASYDTLGMPSDICVSITFHLTSHS